MNARHDPRLWHGMPVPPAGSTDSESWQLSSCLAALARQVTNHPAPVDWDDFSTRLQTCTEAQIRVLWLISCGLLNKQIAHRCGISEATVKSHVAEALKRLRIRSRTAAAARIAVFLDRHMALIERDDPLSA